MKASGIISGALAGVTLLASSVSAQTGAAFTVDPLVIKGKHFFYKTNGSEFFIRGVAYQQDYEATQSDTTASTTDDYTDPIANLSSCARDIPYLVQLRTNVIRTYAINPAADHTDCMNALASAGIYVIADLGAPSTSINRDDPAWNTDLYSRYTQVVDSLATYNNVLGFFAGNEVSNSVNTTAASAFVRAAIRDTKAYITSKKYRAMGVGYATYDGPILDQLAQYFNCGDQSSAIDFWGYNVYSWCGDSSYTASGYDVRTAFFQNYSVPAFFAEYGCNNVEPRPFTEVQALFGPLMTPTWSGGIVYQYFQSTNNYGLVQVSGNTVSTLTDFINYSNQINSITPSSTPASAYSPSYSATTCPSVGPSWSAVASPLPPAPNANLCNCISAESACQVKGSTPETGYGTIFNYICSNDASACDGIASNATSGTYGAYVVCPAEQQLNYVLNQYYIGQSSSASACNFNGAAQTTAAASATGTCSSLIAAVGTGGTGSVSAGTGASATASGSSSSGSSSAASSKGAAAGMSFASLEFGFVHMGLYVMGAALTGVAMIVL